MLSAVIEIGVLPVLLEMLLAAELLVKVPVPASIVTPPGPVTVELFVTPTPVKLTEPAAPVVDTAPPIVRRPAFSFTVRVPPVTLFEPLRLTPPARDEV
jgi:hypothetical protein